jgi:ATP-binding cassette subfamily B (MDR/TAP) protein 1
MAGASTDTEAQHLPDPDRILSKHKSNLPPSLYILSFAPLPVLIRQPREFALHPYTLYLIGTISACIAGVGLPAFDIIFGYWTNGVNSGIPSIINNRGSIAGIIATCIGVVFVTSVSIFLVTCKLMDVICLRSYLTPVTLAGVKLSNLVREQYLSSILSQDQAFFDRVGAGEIITRASRDIDSIRTGLGERLGYLIWASAAIITVSDGPALD